MSYIQTILKTYNYSKDLISHFPFNTFEMVQDIFSYKTLKNQRHLALMMLNQVQCIKLKRM